MRSALAWFVSAAVTLILAGCACLDEAGQTAESRAGTLAGAREPDELDALLREVRPPVRFEGYAANFNVRNVAFKYTELKIATGLIRNVVRETRAIFDGDRMIGYLAPHYERPDLVIEVRLFSMHPRHEAKINPEDWANAKAYRNYARDYGEALEMGAPGALPDETKTEVHGGGKTIAFVRTDLFKPDGVVTGRTGRAVHTATLLLDPQLGYVIEHSFEWRCNVLPMSLQKSTGTMQPAEFGGGSMYGWGVVNPWPGEGTYTQTFFTPGAGMRSTTRRRPFALAGKYALFWINGPTVEEIRHIGHLQLRSGGIVGYLWGREGWGAATTVVGPEDSESGVCPAWLHIGTGRIRPPTQPGQDGMYSVGFRRRMAGLPPEIQEHICKNATVMFEDRKCLAIRLDEDFEDQPLPYATPFRGLRFVGRGVSLTSERAHSGKQAIVTKSIKPEDLSKVDLHEEHPPVCFDPNRRYRLECWILVEGEDTEAFVIGASELEIKDKTVFAKEETVGKTRTASVKKPGEWQKVSYEFTAPAYGGLLSLNFVALGPGKAYFDDFKIVKLPM